MQGSGGAIRLRATQASWARASCASGSSGRARREYDYFGVDLGPRMEIAGADAKMRKDVPVERGVNAERAVSTRAGAGANPLRDLALEHQDHPRDRGMMTAQPFEDRGGGVERKIADYFHRLT